MTASLWDVLKEQLAELRDLLARPLREPRASDILKDVFGPNCTTGKSTVIELALFDDLLRMTEIVLAGRWKPLEPHFTRFALPFFQTAANTFARNGQPGYVSFVPLSAAKAGRFLEHHSQSPQPFGGRHQLTRWSGLTFCESVSLQLQNPDLLSRYERLARTLLSALKKHVIHARQTDFQQLAEFINDRCHDVRDRIAEVGQEDVLDPIQLARERAELNALRAELESQQARLAEREKLMEQEWNHFRRERAEFERLRQRWEEHWEETTQGTAISDAPAETIFVAASKMVSPLQFPPTGTTDDDCVVHLFEEAEAGKPSPTPDEDTEHVLFEEDAEVGEGSTKDHRAALVSEDGVSVLMEAVAAGDREQIQTALHWGLDVNSPDPHHAGQTPLHLAARFGRPEIIALLLNAGADAAFRDADLRTPLEIAILHEQTEAARQLMAHTPQAVSLAHPNLLRMNGASEFRCATAKN